MDDSRKETSTPPISEESSLSHFQSLHSNEPLNSHQEAIIDELTRLEDATTQSHVLDYIITELEIRTAVNKLKNNKSSYSDRIKNEMIKSSLNELMPIYLQLFNAVLTSGTMPQTWCDGLITPIFKMGLKVIPQIIEEFVFLVVLVNYFVQFSIKDFSSTFSRVTYFINLK